MNTNASLRPVLLQTALRRWRRLVRHTLKRLAGVQPPRPAAWDALRRTLDELGVVLTFQEHNALSKLILRLKEYSDGKPKSVLIDVRRLALVIKKAARSSGHYVDYGIDVAKCRPKLSTKHSGQP